MPVDRGRSQPSNGIHVRRRPVPGVASKPVAGPDLVQADHERVTAGLRQHRGRRNGEAAVIPLHQRTLHPPPPPDRQLAVHVDEVGRPPLRGQFAQRHPHRGKVAHEDALGIDGPCRPPHDGPRASVQPYKIRISLSLRR